MNLQRIFVPLIAACLLVAAYHYYQWTGVALVASGLVTWALLHYNRMMQVLSRASKRPMGFVDSAVMLNAKLQPKATLLHVVAMTKALGALQSPKETQPEIYRWTDGTQSQVTCTFLNGKLQSWVLWRPEAAADTFTPHHDDKPSL